MFKSMRASLSLILTIPFFAGCASSPDKDTQGKLSEETKQMVSVEKKAFEQNRYLNADEVKAVTQNMDRIADASSPEDAKKLHALTDAVKKYRSKLDEFKSLGGAKVETLKSREDLDHRIQMIGELKAMNARVKLTCSAANPDPSQLLTVELEGQLLDKIAGQLNFYKGHYGKWHVRNKGPILFEVTPGELAKFNQLAGDIKSLGDQQMQVMKKNTEERLRKMKAGN